MNGTYIVRDPVQRDAGDTLLGRSFFLSLRGGGRGLLERRGGTLGGTGGR